MNLIVELNKRLKKISDNDINNTSLATINLLRELYTTIEHILKKYGLPCRGYPLPKKGIDTEKMNPMFGHSSDCICDACKEFNYIMRGCDEYR